MSDIDPFEQLVREEGTAHFKAKQRATEKRAAALKLKVVQSEKDAPMKLSEQEQKIADSSKQMRAYNRAKRQEIKALLQGPHGDRWRDLVFVLRHLTMESASELIDYVQRQHWLKRCCLHERQVAFDIINSRIVRLRLENGLPPFDDGLPDQDTTAFEIIRDELQVLT